MRYTCGAIASSLWLQKDPGTRFRFLGLAKSRMQSFSAVVCMGRPLWAARVLIEVVHFDGRAVRGAPGVARSV